MDTFVFVFQQKSMDTLVFLLFLQDHLICAHNMHFLEEIKTYLSRHPSNERLC